VRKGTTVAAAFVLVLLVALASAGDARAAFPYPRAASNPGDLTQYKTAPGQIPVEWNFDDNIVWKFAASPEPGNEPVNHNPQELFGVRGASVVDPDPSLKTAWQVTTGRPDVTIATLDSGIKWNERRSMVDLRHKVRLNTHELPIANHDRPASLDPGSVPDCSAGSFPGPPSGGDRYDVNGDGVVNVDDYACDTRVEADPAKRAARGQARGVGPADLLDPQDVIIAFSDGRDGYGAVKTAADPGAEGNGYVDDIAGWDFLDNDNDPFDDVQYGHGTGESLDAAAEADNRDPATGDGKSVSSCPNCMVVPLRVGDSFVADVNRFAQAAIYATDNRVDVIQEALGTLNYSHLARQAAEYAYKHGVTVIASAADESAQHHNWPSSLPHVIVVNSVIKYQGSPAPPGDEPHSYLLFNGCTNFSSKITVAIPSKECSSDATGKGGGMAGLIYSAAYNARDHGKLPNDSGCRRTDGSRCVITPNEVRQVMASGTLDGHGLADDVNFATTERSCSPLPSAGCTDPNLNTSGNYAFTNPVAPAQSRRFPTRAGHDQFTGWGRENLFKSVDAVSSGELPPEAEITSPDWFTKVDPTKSTVAVDGQTYARGGSYTCQVLVAPGSYPNNAKTTDTPPGDFKVVPSAWCNGSARTDRFTGTLANLDLNDLKGRFPPNATGFNGREPGIGTVQTSNGRPNIEPYGFVVKVVVSTSHGGHALTGEDRRNFYLHRDQDMLPGWPKQLPSDGAASPLFADLDGDNRNELILATSDGDVHAYRSDGSELPGWPVHGDALPLHGGDPNGAYAHGDASADARGAFLGSPAVGDLNHDGVPEVVAADLEGKVYAWDAAGKRLFTRESRIEYSGKPLHPFEDVRQGSRNRTQHGFIASPVLADLDRNDGGKLEIVAAGMDRHVYAWNNDGSTVSGFPVLVVDRSKVASIDATTHAVHFDDSKAGDDLDQGAIVDTPAVGDLGGDPRPEIVVGTNEEYAANSGNEPDYNAGRFNAASVAALTGPVLHPGNSRVYAIKPDGYASGNAVSGPDPWVSGWPFKAAIILPGILPVVGEGITGSPIIGPVDCPPTSGGSGPKVGLMPDAGPAYILNPGGDSCYGKDPSNGKDIGLQTDTPGGTGRYDTPSFPALGHPAFGDLGDGVSFFGPTIGLNRALDLQVREYQPGQDFIGAWDSRTGQYRAGWPSPVNDLQFLTGPSIADIDGLPGEEVLEGTASLDLAGLNAAGAPVNQKWPKLTGDWTVANPLAGSFSTLDTSPNAKKVVFLITRSGSMQAFSTAAPACSPGSWPRFHHDNANSGDFRRDDVLPGKATSLSLSRAGATTSLSYDAPGDDGLCGTVAGYEVVSSDGDVTAGNFDSLSPARAPEKPLAAGAQQSLRVTIPIRRRIAVRAFDDQGNRGRVTVYDTALPGGGPDSGPSPPGPGEGPRDTAAPVTRLRAPRYSTDGSPTTRFRVSWSGSDGKGGSGVDSYQLQVRRTGSSSWRTRSFPANRHTTVLRGSQGAAYEMRLRATDRVRNTGAFSYRQTVVPLDDRNRRIRFSRGWRTAHHARAYGGRLARSGRRGARAVLIFRGVRIGVIGSKLRDGGAIAVTVDGRRGVISVRARRGGLRRVLYRSRGLRNGRHVVRVTVVRGPVELDAFAVEP
jgi:hypothetical protein